ncbi:hypothetical protein CEXT_269761 [Caerostris extrusa]|uniref:Ribosomal protein S3 n=1 Tax=Caerostris extrusa TaxID=172846 RepID=A0AAV4PLR4_CAEEX|nr:hypothetical protein CEXT_269761 [Caerostris extrusa]
MIFSLPQKKNSRLTKIKTFLRGPPRSEGNPISGHPIENRLQLTPKRHHFSRDLSLGRGFTTDPLSNVGVNLNNPVAKVHLDVLGVRLSVQMELSSTELTPSPGFINVNENPAAEYKFGPTQARKSLGLATESRNFTEDVIVEGIDNHISRRGEKLSQVRLRANQQSSKDRDVPSTDQIIIQRGRKPPKAETEPIKLKSDYTKLKIKIYAGGSNTKGTKIGAK